MSDHFEETFGPVIGRGAQATVHGRGDYAVKLYRAGYPKGSVFAEAFIMANLEGADFPSPRIHEVLLAEGRYGLRMDLVRGRTLSEELHDPAERAWAIERFRCIQCGCCVEVCPKKCLRMETAQTDVAFEKGRDVFTNA